MPAPVFYARTTNISSIKRDPIGFLFVLCISSDGVILRPSCVLYYPTVEKAESSPNTPHRARTTWQLQNRADKNGAFIVSPIVSPLISSCVPQRTPTRERQPTRHERNADTRRGTRRKAGRQHKRDAPRDEELDETKRHRLAHPIRKNEKKRHAETSPTFTAYRTPASIYDADTTVQHAKTS